MTDTMQRTGLPKLWRIDVERTYRMEVYVLAETKEEAVADAEEMSTEIDLWGDDDSDFFAREVPDWSKLRGVEIWTGGPEGREISVRELDAYLAELAEVEENKPPPEIPGQMRLDGSIVPNDRSPGAETGTAVHDGGDGA